jgi:hypothetical protein
VLKPLKNRLSDNEHFEICARNEENLFWLRHCYHQEMNKFWISLYHTLFINLYMVWDILIWWDYSIESDELSLTGIELATMTKEVAQQVKQPINMQETTTKNYCSRYNLSHRRHCILNLRMEEKSRNMCREKQNVVDSGARWKCAIFHSLVDYFTTRFHMAR